jgi:glycogen(starch) synthase
VRILAVGNMYPPHHQGGYELMWQAAMRAARDAGHEVRVLTTDHREDGERPEEDPDVHRTLRWYWDYRRHEFPDLSVRQRVQLERHNAAELRRHLGELRPDVVTWWSMGCMSLSLIERARRAGIPAVFCVHDDWLVYGPRVDQWIRMWRGARRLLAPFEERTLGIPTRVDLLGAGPMVFNSRSMRDNAVSRGAARAESEVIYPGIDERFLERLPDEEWRWRLLYIGRIERQKGVDTAVRALAELPAEATLTVVGAGDERYVAELREEARAAGVDGRVRFEGFVRSHEEVRRAYAGADAVVFPVRWAEPFGLVPLEAMGLGRPVVSTARGGAVEFLRDGENALLFPPDDARALAQSLTRLADDEPLRAALREGGARTAAEHTLGSFCLRTLDAIERGARR